MTNCPHCGLRRIEEKSLRELMDLEYYKQIDQFPQLTIARLAKAIASRYGTPEESYWKDKCEILEKEREEWWSKAEKPDECYIPISEHKRLMKAGTPEIDLFDAFKGMTRDEIAGKLFQLYDGSKATSEIWKLADKVFTHLKEER